jgi:hypothetical protein
MKKLIFIGAIVLICCSKSFATETPYTWSSANCSSSTTTTNVYGRNTGTTPTGQPICDNFWQDMICYTTIVVTSALEEPGTINTGDPISIIPYDTNGNPIRSQILSGIYVSSSQSPDPNCETCIDYYFDIQTGD